MDPVSFVGAWREEAFGLWTSQWASIYAEGGESHSLLCDMAETYFLVNVVENDFMGGDIFRPFLEALDLLKAQEDKRRGGGATGTGGVSVAPPRRDPKLFAQVLEQQRAAEAVMLQQM